MSVASDTLRKIGPGAAAAATITLMGVPAIPAIMAGVGATVGAEVVRDKVARNKAEKEYARQNLESFKNSQYALLAQNDLLMMNNGNGYLDKGVPRVEFDKRGNMKLTNDNISDFSIANAGKRVVDATVNTAKNVGEKVTDSTKRVADATANSMKYGSPLESSLVFTGAKVLENAVLPPGSAVGDVLRGYKNPQRRNMSESPYVEHLLNTITVGNPSSLEKSYGVDSPYNMTQAEKKYEIEVPSQVKAYLEEYEVIDRTCDKSINLFWERAKSSLSEDDYEILKSKLSVD